MKPKMRLQARYANSIVYTKRNNDLKVVGEGLFEERFDSLFLEEVAEYTTKRSFDFTLSVTVGICVCIV